MRVARYTLVSACSILLTQALLVVLTLAGLPPAAANVIAVLAAAIPAFLLNRAWTWGDRDDHRLRRQITIFWTTVLAGLLLSTAAVAAVERVTTAPQTLAAANLAAFGALWVARFVVLDRFAFVDPDRDAGSARSWRSTAARYLPALPVASAIAVATIVHGWRLADYPARFDDEGTYVSQAWAVMSSGELSHYTYWYDHPPIGWFQLIPWLWISGAFERGVSAIAAGREMMLIVHVISVALLYVWARRLNVSRGLAAAAVLLFSLSPLALYWQRQVLLDNFAVMWTLAAFVLIRSPQQRLSAHAGAGICFAMAVLSKETIVLLLPALIMELWHASDTRTRRYSFAVAGSALGAAVIIYPLMALLRGELLPGDGHVSLWDGIAFQLFEREGSGFVLDAWSNSNNIVSGWLAQDPWLLGAGVVLIPIALTRRRLRPAAVALLITVVLLLRPGYLPVPYLIAMLPFAAIVIAGVGDEFWQLLVRRRTTPGWRAWTGRVVGRVAGSTALVSMIAVGAMYTAPRWANAVDRQLTTREDGPTRDAEAWLRGNVAQDATLLVDNTIWLDLLVDGYERERVVWYYKLDLDPEVAAKFPRRWRDFDYIVSTEGVRSTEYLVPSVKAALANSRVMVTYGTGDTRVEVRKIDPNGME